MFIAVIALSISIENATFAQYYGRFDGWSYFTIGTADMLAWLLLGAAIFWTRWRPISDRWFLAMRLASAALGVVIMALLTVSASSITAGPHSLADERRAVATTYTDTFDVSGCTGYARDLMVTIRHDLNTRRCTVTLRIDMYSVVVYPDAPTIQLADLKTSVEKDVLRLDFPDHGLVTFLIFRDDDAKYARPLSESGIDVTQPHFTALTSRWTV